MNPPSPPPALFDRAQLQRQRRRAAKNYKDFAILEPQIAAAMRDRLAGINRKFNRRLEIGASAMPGLLLDGDGEAIRCALAEDPASRSEGLRIVGDDELLPFAAKSFDLIISSLSLHWVNDLPGALVQIKNSLKPDGLFMAALLGGDSLQELRRALTEAELELHGGAAARVSPFAEIRDLGDLLQRTGFVMPVADLEGITVRYKDLFALMRDLRGSGNANALHDRVRHSPGRQFFARANEIYRERFAGADGLLPATFDIIYLTAWAPGPGQPVAKLPGSATHSLAEALPSREIEES